MAIGQGGYQGDIDAIAAALADRSAGGEFVDEIRYGPQQSGAWHGEHETYATEQQFIEGEKLQDLMPQDTSWGMRPTYANTFTEAIAENPVMNAFVDARGMLRQGGGPGFMDWAMLGLSGLPMVAPYARTAGSAITSRLRNTVADDILDTQLRAKDFQTTKTLDELSLESQLPPKPGIEIRGQVYDDPYMYLAFPETAPKLIRGTELADRALKLNANSILVEAPSVRDVLTMSADDFYRMDKRMQDKSLQGAGLTRSDIETLHWVNEGKAQSEAIVQMSNKIGNKELAKETQNLIDRWAKKIAATPDEILQKIGLGRGLGGKLADDLAEMVRKFDEANNIVDFPKIKSTRELSEIFDDAGAPPGTIENLVKFKGYDPDKALKNLDTAFKESRANAVAEKMSWKPDNISHEHWAQFTEKLTMKQVENAYRQLTLRLID